MNEIENKLSDIYYKTIISPTLHDLAKKAGVSQSIAREFIKNQENYQLFKPTDKKIKYFPIIGVPGTFQSDLFFYDQFKKSNNGYHVLLTAIEVNSRRGYVIPLKNKTIDSIIEGFKLIIEKSQQYIPVKSVTTDSGSEFKKKFTDFLNNQNIDHFLTDPGNKHQLGMGERFNRTMRNSIEKYMTTYNTNRYIDVQDKMLEMDDLSHLVSQKRS
eukprot:Lithocolla_globosa_v1_NODE_149_length_5681_cov_13.915926.p2 type:complete len:214 gc:universal NODE_149_length_5681_cov_13.915926:3662-3021(-)